MISQCYKRYGAQDAPCWVIHYKIILTISNRRKYEKRIYILCLLCNSSYIYDDKSPHICIDPEPISEVAIEIDLKNLLN